MEENNVSSYIIIIINYCHKNQQQAVHKIHSKQKKNMYKYQQFKISNINKFMTKDKVRISKLLPFLPFLPSLPFSPLNDP